MKTRSTTTNNNDSGVM